MINQNILKNAFTLLTINLFNLKNGLLQTWYGLFWNDSSCDIISRGVAKNESYQEVELGINGNAACKGHAECDSIIMDNAYVLATPQLSAATTEASLIHEAAIGKIAGEQMIKLMTLGLTEKEAEEQIVNGFLKWEKYYIMH